jgi:drug/metabolite transporter (DMT)-like permease
MLLIVILYALYGATFIFIKKSLIYGSYIDLTWFRALLITIVSIPHIIIYRKHVVTLLKNRLIPLLIYSSLIFISGLSLHWASQYTSPVKAAIYYTLAPFITALIGHFFFKEHINRKKLIGIIISAVGVAIMIYEKNSGQVNISESIIADIVLIIAVTSFSLGWLVIKKTIRKEDAPITAINGLSAIFVMLACTPLLLSQTHSVASLPLDFWKWASLETITGGVIGCTLYMFLLNSYSATLLALASLLEPCFTAAYIFILLQIVPENTTIIATLFIGIGLTMFYLESLKIKRS